MDAIDVFRPKNHRMLSKPERQLYIIDSIRSSSAGNILVRQSDSRFHVRYLDTSYEISSTVNLLFVYACTYVCIRAT